MASSSAATAFCRCPSSITKRTWTDRDFCHSETSPGALIGRHLQALLEVAPSMMQTECEMAVEASIGLITACLRAEVQRADQGAGTTGEGDRLIRIKQHIEARLGDADLSGESILRQQGNAACSLAA